VRWELTPTESGTHVKVTHSGLADEPAACRGYAGGWPGVLEEIKTHAEK
jgi:Activator of Hsp90 ATPase homolog 1-like protein